jgi:outer membrane lipoprotein SlyB
LFPGSNTKGVQVVQPGDILWKPGGQQQNSFTFAPLDDVVMGGASSSGFDAATGKWTGQVTDANNGGFVGIRSTPNLQLDMTNCKGLELKLRSNKQKRLKVAVRDSTEFNGVVWSTSVDLKNGRVLRVPFAKQVPTVFARIVDDNKPFRKDAVTAMQLVYSKFEYDGKLNPRFELGDVDVQIEEIKAY